MLSRLANTWPPADWQEVTVLVAVSGGADSTALVRALAELKTGGEGRLVLAHFNHQLRGAESDADEAFVRDLAVKLGLPCDVGRPSQAVGSSLVVSEESARDARYAFFIEAAGRWGARYLATAHTSDDQVETVLHRLIRGTGIGGLAGIPRTRPQTEFTTIVRPLLGVTRAEVLDYLTSLGQTFRTDSSNLAPTFTRNRLRNELVPWLEANVNPRAREAILRLAEQAGETADFLRQQASDLLDRCLVPSNPHAPREGHLADSATLSLALLANSPRVLLRQMFVELWRRWGWPEQGMGAAEWESLASVAGSGPESAAFQLPGGVSIQLAGASLTLTRLL